MIKLLTVSTLTMIFLLASGVTTQAAAAGTWYDNCVIERVGTDENGSVLVKLSHSEFGDSTGWFQITQGADRALSIILTALSTGRSLKIKADTSTATGQYNGKIYILYINK